MSANHSPYLPSDESGKRFLYPDGDPDCHQNLIVFNWPIAKFPWTFHANPFGSFCVKLLTDRQTNNDDYVSSLAEVIIFKDFNIRTAPPSVAHHIFYCTAWFHHKIKPGIERVHAKHSLTFRVRTMLSYREVEASLLVAWSLTPLFNTNTAILETKASFVTMVRVMLP